MINRPHDGSPWLTTPGGVRAEFKNPLAIRFTVTGWRFSWRQKSEQRSWRSRTLLSDPNRHWRYWGRPTTPKEENAAATVSGLAKTKRVFQKCLPLVLFTQRSLNRVGNRVGVDLGELLVGGVMLQRAIDKINTNYEINKTPEKTSELQLWGIYTSVTVKTLHMLKDVL